MLPGLVVPSSGVTSVFTFSMSPASPPVPHAQMVLSDVPRWSRVIPGLTSDCPGAGSPEAAHIASEYQPKNGAWWSRRVWLASCWDLLRPSGTASFVRLLP